MNDQNQNLPEGAKSIDNLDQFAFLISSWFDHNHKMLSQVMDVPEGQSVTVQLGEDSPAEELVLTGDLLKGFKAGMIVAQSLFEELPFDRLVVPDDTDGAVNDPAIAPV